MNTRLPLLSAQMQQVLRLLDSEGSMTARQLNDRLYQPALSKSRRVLAASMSRTIRRLEQRGLIFCEGGAIAITEIGRYKIHPEQFEAVLTSLRESVRQGVAQICAEYIESQKSKAEAQNDAA